MAETLGKSSEWLKFNFAIDENGKFEIRSYGTRSYYWIIHDNGRIKLRVYADGSGTVGSLDVKFVLTSKIKIYSGPFMNYHNALRKIYFMNQQTDKIDKIEKSIP